MTPQMMLWIAFGAVVAAAFALDLGLFNRKGRTFGIRGAIVRSLFWVALALIFNLGVWYWRGSGTALEFLTAYLVEESLSVDNLFIFLMIFSYFGVPVRHQHKALLWGIAGVLIMRGIFIFAGIALIERFHWIIYALGAFLVLTGAKMAFQRDREVRPDSNPIIRLFRKMMPVSEGWEADGFFVRRAGRLFATPLLIVVLAIETTDVIFAVDSIPAVFAITTDPFVVFTSNIFAILGLRAIFFALSGFMQLFHHLKYGLAVILSLIGIKMLISDVYRIPVGIALGAIACILAISVATSAIWPPATKPLAGSKPLE
ncbi:MAG: TerC family protein [Pseudomonadota bacterium]